MVQIRIINTDGDGVDDGMRSIPIVQIRTILTRMMMVS